MYKIDELNNWRKVCKHVSSLTVYQSTDDTSLARSPAWPIPRIDIHCDRIHFSPLFCRKAVSGLDTILCEYWLKELQESMNGCNSHRDLREVMLKMALNMIGLNQSLQTTQLKFNPNVGINLCDWVKT